MRSPAPGAASGSSPRVRGTRPVRGGGRREYRFIPACAGNTRRPRRRAGPSSVHPRVCGEHAAISRRRVGLIGSSPRVRGTPANYRYGPSSHRFIPACAGNTSTPSVTRPRSSVHPRVCGEHVSAPSIGKTQAGSSPRVRGTRTARPRRSALQRFIPACAGNTSPPRESAAHGPVHPRVCGEHAALHVAGDLADGSSPRVRGTRSRQFHGGRGRRFIPACAGNTPGATRRRARIPVHPRVCGEHILPHSSVFFRYGSSPRVRGTPSVEVSVGSVRRFIPACAGNTRSVRGPIAGRSVHPRVCGEHFERGARLVDGGGSSPRVRGTPKVTSRPRMSRRFIPACAGNTQTCKPRRELL